MQHFASDNYSGMCPEALECLIQANVSGDEPSYGNDAWTAKACQAFRELFEKDCEVFFVFNGTSANALALASLCRSYQSVICHESAHVETDECGAPEFFSNGSKLLIGKGAAGKLTAESVEEIIHRRSDIHYPRPAVVTLTQATEMGTVYSVDEIKAVTKVAKENGLKVHMDGARFANAIAYLGVSPADVTWKAGVDVLCFGGTKNGLPVGEAIVFFDSAEAEGFAYRVKQAGQLASKMRFISAPWLGLLENDVWLRNATNANAMTQLLYKEIHEIPGVQVMWTPEANALFMDLPAEAAAELREQGWVFYEFIGGYARLMCAWDTKRETVMAFARSLSEVCSRREEMALR